MSTESQFQSKLIRKLRDKYPGAIILKNDAGYLQGMADLLILNGPKWAALECKANEFAPYRPNQEFYIDLLDQMSFCRAIFPENEWEVLRALQRSFES